MRTNIEALRDLQLDLKKAATMQDFLRICAEHYDFKNARLGTISKMTLIANIGKVIGLSGAKPK